ncbi:hypothetical protein, partial [Acidiphilium multivorum]|uniref:hypothetical protein n=1 Tax=Acidiphilium multivorum TaxID=62140 RepID=UPI0006626C4D
PGRRRHADARAGRRFGDAGAGRQRNARAWRRADDAGAGTLGTIGAGAALAGQGDGFGRPFFISSYPVCVTKLAFALQNV